VTSYLFYGRRKREEKEEEDDDDEEEHDAQKKKGQVQVTSRLLLWKLDTSVEWDAFF